MVEVRKTQKLLRKLTNTQSSDKIVIDKRNEMTKVTHKTLEQLYPKQWETWNPAMRELCTNAFKRLGGNLEDFKVWVKIMRSKKDRAYFESLNLGPYSYYVECPKKELLDRFRIYWTTQDYMHTLFLGDLVSTRELLEQRVNKTAQEQDVYRRNNIFYLYNHAHNQWLGKQDVFHYSELMSFIADRNLHGRLTLVMTEINIEVVEKSGELINIKLDPTKLDPLTPKVGSPSKTTRNWET